MRIVALGLAGLLGASVAQAVVQTAGNSFYRVHIEDSGTSMGQYTVTTGPEHPAGSGLNVLFGGGNPGTSFNSLRSFTTGLIYSQRPTGGTVPLGIFGVVTPLDTTGFRTTYTLPGLPVTFDQMTIIQDLRVNGSNFSNSSVEITTTINNTGAASLSVGVRYLWDIQVAQDDGPTFQAILPTSPVLVTETEFNNPNFQAFRIEDNDVNPMVPTFNVFGTVNGPPSIVPTPTRPSRLVYASWPASASTQFEYLVDPSRNIASSGGDSAVLYYFGGSFTNALTVAPGASVRASASLFLTPPGFVLGGIEQLDCQVTIPDPDPTHDGCVTRTARFWLTHPVGDSDSCVSLLRALQMNGGGIDLGFICLPTTYRNADNVADEVDATIEALGLYWRGPKRTGEENGTQSEKLPGSRLCRARKKFAGEMIAATANVVLLGTDPAKCGFPSNLLQQAGAVAAGVDAAAINAMTATLRQFNASGQTNQLPAGLEECSEFGRKELRRVALDPTNQETCPGINNSCLSAEALVSFPSSRQVDLVRFTDAFPSPTCGTGGPEAVWKVEPPVAARGRNFVVDTRDSNIDTLVSIWQGGSCADAVQTNCAVMPVISATTPLLQFTADGTNTYFIVIEGANGAIGRVKVRFRSF